MAHQYKTLYYSSPEELDLVIGQYLKKGWDLWGNPFALTIPASGLRIYHQAVVRFDPSGHSVVGKLDAALTETAGYSMQVPETAEPIIGCDGPRVESAVSLFNLPNVEDFRQLINAITEQRRLI